MLPFPYLSLIHASLLWYPQLQSTLVCLPCSAAALQVSSSPLFWACLIVNRVRGAWDHSIPSLVRLFWNKSWSWSFGQWPRL